MSEINEIQVGIDDEITTGMEWVFTIIAALITAGIGVVVGAVVGFYGLYFFCVLMGDVYVQAGWALLFVTVPVGMLAGGILGGSLPLLFHVRWK
ncbi:hypothetical protein [Gimesia panareensis]|uniref:hypothetical protein n=1 Tax=Gimesia panareensis TaxID=2527978 RepID=UPI00118B49A8|nr:hypothetical protein [Gimesia panareensis]QDU53734.1 hypothetical protein Pan110_61280 [Gimesia panareensis]